MTSLSRWGLVPLLVVGFGFLAHGLVAEMLALALGAPSPWSVDAWLRRRRQVPERLRRRGSAVIAAGRTV